MHSTADFYRDEQALGTGDEDDRQDQQEAYHRARHSLRRRIGHRDDLTGRHGLASKGALGAGALGAGALGALALGAFAVGALAVGAFAIGRLSVGRARAEEAEIGRLRIGALEIGSLLYPAPPRDGETR
ncbi:hypothetical protein [Consotaella aegiceratis]|uniref:hypothetical protein n=1 Tax=Consotaella aegiceratis TaxID=3097961 RepID=UPI002F3ED781